MSEGKTPAQEDRLTRLINMAVELTSEIEELAHESGHQLTSLARASRTNRMMIWGVIAGGVLDIFLTVVLVIVGMGQVDNTNRIDQLQRENTAADNEARTRALCPLYGIFLDSKSPQGRAAAPDPKKYDHAFEVIADGYHVLGCDAFLKESGKDQW